MNNNGNILYTSMWYYILKATQRGVNYTLLHAAWMYYGASFSLQIMWYNEFAWPWLWATFQQHAHTGGLQKCRLEHYYKSGWVRLLQMQRFINQSDSF